MANSRVQGKLTRKKWWFDAIIALLGLGVAVCRQDPAYAAVDPLRPPTDAEVIGKFTSNRPLFDELLAAAQKMDPSPKYDSEGRGGCTYRPNLIGQSLKCANRQDRTVANEELCRRLAKATGSELIQFERNGDFLWLDVNLYASGFAFAHAGHSEGIQFQEDKRRLNGPVVESLDIYFPHQGATKDLEGDVAYREIADHWYIYFAN